MLWIILIVAALYLNGVRLQKQEKATDAAKEKKKAARKRKGMENLRF